MKKLASLIISAAFIVFGMNSLALADGMGFYVPAPAPVATPEQPVETCDPITAPDMEVFSPTENDVIEGPAGSWTLYFYPQQQTAEWEVNWTDTSVAPDVTYMFEVSASPAVNANGAFVSPIASYNVNGTSTSSPQMDIDFGEVFYFHVKADSPERCPGEYAPVEQISTTYRNVISVNSVNAEIPLVVSAVLGVGASALNRKRD